MSIQKQLSELQKQIEFIYTTINNLISSEVRTKESLDNLQKRLNDYTCELLELYYKDSETNKESPSEKESK
jgi:chaperonin cofactor prefoldin